jgi:hypothetical protein
MVRWTMALVSDVAASSAIGCVPDVSLVQGWHVFVTFQLVGRGVVLVIVQVDGRQGVFVMLQLVGRWVVFVVSHLVKRVSCFR